MNSSHARQSIYRIRMLVLILNEKWEKFSLFVENDDKKNSLLENDMSKT
jgi:hypothetical protein